MIATFLRTGEIEVVAKRVEQRRPRGDFELPLLPVDMERNRNLGRCRAGCGPRRAACLRHAELLLKEKYCHRAIGIALLDLNGAFTIARRPANAARRRRYITLSSLIGCLDWGDNLRAELTDSCSPGAIENMRK